MPRFKRKRGYSRSNPRKKFRQAYSKKRAMVTSGRGVTDQHDRQFIYRKKSMPYRQKKRWIQFKRKVNAVAEKELGSRTVVFNKRFDFKNVNPLNQTVGFASLYSLKSDTYSHQNDLFRISTYENANDPTADKGETIDLTTKYLFQSGVLDLTMRNLSYFSVATPGTDPEVLNSEATLEVDVYEILINGNTNDRLNTYDDPTKPFRAAAADTKVIGGLPVGTDLDILRRGVTPFDLPQALSRYRIKIMKKTKMFIKSGQTATYQLRDPKRHVSTQQYMNEVNGCNKAGWTKHILVICKAIPGVAVGEYSASVANTTEQLTMGITRKYMYKIEGMNDSRDIYQNL